MTIADRRIAWASTKRLVPYDSATSLMHRRAGEIRDRQAPELIWLLEHPPLYTAGTSTNPKDLLDADSFPVHETGRGGQLTYHGPGQRVVYVMIDVRERFDSDVRAFVSALEQCIILSLANFGLKGETRRDRVGVWIEAECEGKRSEAKIAAIGIRIRHGISFHGASLNVAPNLTHYAGIVPCGIGNYGVTSLEALGVKAPLKDVDKSLRSAFEQIFGPTLDAPDPIEIFERHTREDPKAPK